MIEQAFPSGDGPGAADDLLRAAILHHLLTREPRGVRGCDLSRALLGAVPAARRDALCAAALARLMRDGLVECGAGRWRATRAARAFHRLMTRGAA
jgi:hypothetical protein